MKKITALFVALLMISIVFAGCTTTSTTEATTTEATTQATTETPKDYTVDEILDAIKEAYGESYLPNMEIDETMLTDTFGIDMSKVEDVAAEMPMIGFHPDRVIVIKAVSGEGEAIEEELNAAKETLINESLQYPANLAKVNATKVIRHGDYVCFLLVGAPDDVSETEEDAAKFAEDEVSKAVDAVNALFE